MRKFITFLICLLSLSALGQYKPNYYDTNSAPVLSPSATNAVNVLATNAVLGVIAGSNQYNGTFVGGGSGVTNLNGSNISSGTVDIARLPTNVLTNNSTVPWFSTNKFTMIGHNFSTDPSPPILSVLSAPMPALTLHQGTGTGVALIVGDGDNATGDWWVSGGGIVSGHWFGATDFTLAGNGHTTLQTELSTRMVITNAYGSFLQVDCPNTDKFRVENYEGFMSVSGTLSSNCFAYNGDGIVVADVQYGSDAITNYCNGNSILMTIAESATNVNCYSYFGSFALTIADSALTVSNQAQFCSLAFCNAIRSTNVFNNVQYGSFGLLNGWFNGADPDFGCLNATNEVGTGSFGLANVFGSTNTWNQAYGNSFSFLNAGLAAQNIYSRASDGSFGMVWTVDSKAITAYIANNSFLQSQLISCDNIAYDLNNSFCNVYAETITNASFTAANSLIIGKLQSGTTYSFTDTIGVTTDAGTSVFTPTEASIAGVGMTNGQVNAPLGYYQDHYSLDQSFAMFTNKQLYCVAGTNQVVTLIPAAANPWVIYRVTTTNGNGNFTITNSASDNATIRNGIDHTLKQIGVGEVGLFSDGANWQLASKARTVWPNAQFSCTTNIALTTAARAVSFNTTDFNNSQGIALLVGTNATWGHTSIWITNAGQYEFDPSVVEQFGGNTTVRMWFKSNGTNIPNSMTYCIGASAGTAKVVTVPFQVNVSTPTQFEIWAISTAVSGDSFEAAAAGGAAPNDYPLCPSIICPIKRISDPRP